VNLADSHSVAPEAVRGAFMMRKPVFAWPEFYSGARRKQSLCLCERGIGTLDAVHAP
jgi:hypothetical protein